VPDPTTPEEALEQKLAELGLERARLKGELARVDGERELYARALGILRGDLTAMNEADTTGSTMLTENRVRISRGLRTGRRKAKGTERLLAAADAARHTLRSLAEKVGTNQPHLTRAALGLQPMPKSLAKKIEAELKVKGGPGYRATRENWPKLRDDT
jgi:hypothetical protein